MLNRIFGQKNESAQRVVEESAVKQIDGSLIDNIQPRDPLLVATERVQELLDRAESCRIFFDEAKAHAEEALVNPSALTPEDLHTTLIRAREAESAHQAAAREHEAASSELESLRTRIELEKVKARREAYEAAVYAYRLDCEALLRRSFEIRRLAAEAGTWVPHWDRGDLLIDNTAEVSVAGRPIDFWTRG